MDRSLRLLLKLQTIGWARRFSRGLRTLKGGLLLLVGTMVVLPMVTLSMFAPRVQPAEQHAAILRFGPLALLGTCLLNALLMTGNTAVSYSSVELNFLGAGPYRRRQLLFYKLTASLGATFVSALILTPIVGQHAENLLAAFIGIFLIFEFFYLITFASGLASARLEPMRNRRTSIVVGAIILALGVGLIALTPKPFEVVPYEILGRLETSSVVRGLLSPFRPFVLTFAAERLWPDLVAWSTVAAAIDLTMLVVVVALEARIKATEVGVSGSGRNPRDTSLNGGADYHARGSRFTCLWLGGLYANLWRQALTLVRPPLRLTGLVVLFLIPIVSTLLTVKEPSRAFSSAPELLANILPTLVGVSLFAPSVIAFDFRADVFQIETLKTLPIAARRLVLGQLATTTVVLTAAHWFTLAAIASLVPIGPSTLVGLSALAAPWNLCLVEVENLVFLWFPSRNAASLAVDFQTVGRQMFTMMAKVACIGFVSAVAAGLGTVAYYGLGESRIAGFAVATLVFSGASWALLYLVTLAFTQFDIARDIPA
ncbi:hypothetical protein ACYOEI_10735 [Singulisphaera rosea]